MSSNRSVHLSATVATTAASMLIAATSARAQTTPCEAIFEPVLAAGIAEADRHLRQQWAMIDGNWVAAYRLEGEKANPFDPARLREKSQQRPAATAPGALVGPKPPQPGAAQANPALAALPPIAGYATARDVRCNTTAASAKSDVVLVYMAAGVRFQEGKGPWSAVLPNAVIAAIQLRRMGDGWTIIDRTAEGGVMPPDAKRSPPDDALARQLATVPWLPPRRSRKSRRR